MVRERIKELVDFATTESPYRDANKGWLTEDVYIKWGASQEKSSSQSNELANISVYWKPINQIVSILFIVVVLAAILVFVSVSFAHGRFQIPIGPSTSSITEIPQIDLKESLQVPGSEEEKNNSFELPRLDPLAGIKTDEAKTTNDKIQFGASALGGQKFKSSNSNEAVPIKTIETAQKNSNSNPV